MHIRCSNVIWSTVAWSANVYDFHKVRSHWLHLHLHLQQDLFATTSWRCLLPQQPLYVINCHREWQLKTGECRLKTGEWSRPIADFVIGGQKLWPQVRWRYCIWSLRPLRVINKRCVCSPCGVQSLATTSFILLVFTFLYTYIHVNIYLFFSLIKAVCLSLVLYLQQHQQQQQQRRRRLGLSLGFVYRFI